MAELAEAVGARCGNCGGYAQVEPGGYRCLTCGYCPLLRRVLPHDHQLSGRDWRNRARQRALDRTMLRPSRMEEFLFEMLERLEGRGDGAKAPA